MLILYKNCQNCGFKNTKKASSCNRCNEVLVGAAKISAEFFTIVLVVALGLGTVLAEKTPIQKERVIIESPKKTDGLAYSMPSDLQLANDPLVSGQQPTENNPQTSESPSAPAFNSVVSTSSTTTVSPSGSPSATTEPTSAPSPAPTSSPNQIPLPSPSSTPSASQTPSPIPTPTPENVQLTFKVYWKNNKPVYDYKSTVCIGELSVVWGHFTLITPSGQEIDKGTQDFRETPCQVRAENSGSLEGLPLGEYTFRAVFDELGITKSVKAILSPPV